MEKIKRYDISEDKAQELIAEHGLEQRTEKAALSTWNDVPYHKRRTGSGNELLRRRILDESREGTVVGKNGKYAATDSSPACRGSP